MHEMGIASSVLETVQAEARQHPGSRVSKVGMKIGEWSGVDTDSLRFCVEALIAGTELADMKLEIDYITRKNRCPECNLLFDVVEWEIQCPQCGAAKTIAAAGAELEVAYLELEE